MKLAYFVITALSLFVFINMIPVSFAQTAEPANITLDRDVYPVPWGTLDDFAPASDDFAPSGRSIYPIHITGIVPTGINNHTKTLGGGNVIIHVQIHDSDFNKSPTKQDQISEAGYGNSGKLSSHGLVKVYVGRGSEITLLATAGFQKNNSDVGRITSGINVDEAGALQTRELGPITESEPDSGIFEFDLAIRYTDGPASKTCPATTSYVSASSGARSDDYLVRFDDPTEAVGYHCILKDDILTVEYIDGTEPDNLNILSDSATFGLTTGKLETDKTSYILGSNMILTLTDFDLNLDSKIIETYPLDIIEWDSASATITIGNGGGQAEAFDHVPSEFRETGENTGVFQVVSRIPILLNNNTLERGEEIILEYTDWGPSQASYVGQDDEDIDVGIFTAGFGATIELDQKSYTQNDKVYINIVAPDRNLDSQTIDHIGTSDSGELTLSTKDNILAGYRLAETGPNTGIFIGEVTLNDKATSGIGPKDGLLQANEDDTITVSYEFSSGEMIVYSAIIQKTTEKDDVILPPLQQLMQGVAIRDIQCKDDLQYVIKTSNGNPACVNLKTKFELIDRGWTHYRLVSSEPQTPLFQTLLPHMVKDIKEASDITGLSNFAPTYLPAGYEIEAITTTGDSQVQMWISKYPITETTTLKEWQFRQSGIHFQVNKVESETDRLLDIVKQNWSRFNVQEIMINGKKALMIGISNEHPNGLGSDVPASIFLVDGKVSITFSGFIPTEELIKIAESIT